MNYMVGGIWIINQIDEYVSSQTLLARPLQLIETPIGTTGDIDQFSYSVPGLLILGVIMLMFSAAVAFVAEVEEKTIHRLKLSRVSTLEYLSGITIVQIIVGFLTILLTLAIAVWLGFEIAGSIVPFFMLVLLTCVSIIAFSLIIAAMTKTVNEVLIVANFPLLLFMFFTGAAFPIQSGPWFSIAGYEINLQSFLSPTHAITALKKIMLMGMAAGDIIPEITALISITVLYFVVGLWGFRARHMKIQ